MTSQSGFITRHCHRGVGESQVKGDERRESVEEVPAGESFTCRLRKNYDPHTQGQP